MSKDQILIEAFFFDDPVPKKYLIPIDHEYAKIVLEQYNTKPVINVFSESLEKGNPFYQILFEPFRFKLLGDKVITKIVQFHFVD